MFTSLELVAYGAAVLTDTVLLVALLDARNYARVMLPLIILAISIWVFHLATFCHAYFDNLLTGWAPAIHLSAMVGMILGLALMPSALLHLLWRLRTHGFALNTPADSRVTFLYWPLLLVPVVARPIGNDPEARFLDICRPFAVPYLVWTAVVILFAVVTCFRLGRSEQDVRHRQLFHWLGWTLLGVSALLAVAVPAALAWPAALPILQCLAVLAPLAPVALFVYFVMRFNFLKLFIERTHVFAAVGVALLLTYELQLNDIHSQIRQSWGINPEVLQGAVVIVLLMLVPKVRRRVLEATRYLVSGPRLIVQRDLLRRLSLLITLRAGESPLTLCETFATGLTQALDLAYVKPFLANAAGQLKAIAESDELPNEHVTQLYKELRKDKRIVCTWRDASSVASLAALEECDASGAIVFSARRWEGLLLLGRRRQNRDFSAEEAAILMVLVEQLAVTMEVSQLQHDRLAAERQAQQNERLRTIGLLASAVAHEVRNPLSAIKTIAAVMAEELGASSPHADDLHLIVSEVNRLSQSTSDLLAFARPAPEGGPAGSLTAALNSTLAVLRHHARQLEISLDADVPAGLPDARIAGSALQEIFFNLLNNSIEAAGRGGRVTVACCQHNGHVVTEVRDNGPGIEPTIQNQLFQPFVTTKDSGGGMGLYIVGCRVREAGGTIECASRPQQGTTFIVRLPIAAS